MRFGKPIKKDRVSVLCYILAYCCLCYILKHHHWSSSSALDQRLAISNADRALDFGRIFLSAEP